MTSIAVIGPGAIGATVATWLTRAGYAPAICVRTHVKWLWIDTPNGRLVANPPMLTNPIGLKPVDWVLVCTKAYDVAAAARWLLPLVNPRTHVAILQNGVEHRERFARFVPTVRIVPVVVDIPAERLGPGWVKQHRYGTLTMPDDVPGRAFAKLFARTRIEARTADDWTSVAWRKLAINSCGIALTLIVKPFGAVHDEGVAAAMRVLVEECAAVGRAEGADLPADIAEEVIGYYRAQAPTLMNSMHADRIAGRPMEIDARDGVVVRLGEKHGIPTPAHRMMIDLLAAATA